MDAERTGRQATGRPIATGQFPVVGIGASAGGLDAYRQFFKAMPADSGAAFVLIQHLDPTHESLTAELLGQHTTMSVQQVTRPMVVEPNHVYVIPPNRYLSIERGKLRLTEPAERRGMRMPVDFFLRSLAADLHERAVGIILSGSGTDGTLGLKEVKAAGGLTLAQDPKTAQYDVMPRSAIASGSVDHVLPVGRMPEVLMRYGRHSYVRNQGSEAQSEARGRDELNAVIAILRTRVKFDFSWYKKGTLVRRIQRRMSLRHLDRVGDYVKLLRQDADEVNGLFKDLLINVTSFFREPACWEALRVQAVGPLVAQKADGAPVRVWVPGCATGEDAYSAGILVIEELQRARKACPLQIFASDVDGDSLDFARTGLYPESIAADVSPERLRRFFVRGDSSFRVSKELRESVTFAQQNLLADPPFSKIDLVCCRNLMIYLESEVQKRVLSLLHFALNERGYLFLGSAESIGGQDDLFETISKKCRIYRRIGPTRHDRLQFPPPGVRDAQRSAEPPAPARPAARLGAIAQQLLLERYAPACVVINPKYEILYYSGATHDYLVQPTGPPTQNLLSMVREGLHTKLRGAVHRAARENRAVVVDDARVRRGRHAHRVHIVVEPLRGTKEIDGLLLVSFSDKAPRTAVETSRAPLAPETRDESLLQQLESELRATREDLQSTIEELETSNEELKASNEEVMSVNEELQSTNEELETSKEELQSLNEELSTVNNQLESKVAELESTNDDLNNLLVSTDLATLFLDRQFRIRRFTPAMTRLLRLIPTDVGRPISDLASPVVTEELLQSAQQVLQALSATETEVQFDPDHWYVRRILPYRTEDNHIDGVVITFTDITARKRAELAAALANRQLSADLDAMLRLHAISTRRLDGDDLRPVLAEILSAAIAITAADMGNVQLVDAESGRLRIVAQRGFKRPFLDFWNQTASGEGACGSALARGERVIVEDVSRSPIFAGSPGLEVLLAAGVRAVQSTPLVSRSGKLLGVFSTHYTAPRRPDDRALRLLDLLARQAADIIERNRAEREIRTLNADLERRVAERTAELVATGERLRAAHDRLQAIVQFAGDGIITIDSAGTIESFNPAAERIFGHSAADVIGGPVGVLMPPPHAAEHANYIRRYLETGEAHILGLSREVEGKRRDGTTFPLDLAVSELRDERGRHFVGLVHDLSERRRREAEVRELERTLSELSIREQRRIGRELHDQIGQVLSGTAMLARSLEEKLRSQGSPASDTASGIVRQLRTAYSQVRDLARGLAPVMTTEHGLNNALADLAESTRSVFGVSCEYHDQREAQVSDIETAEHLYRIAQEAVTNAVRHASPRTILIRFERVAEGLCLSVQDDGVGLSDAAAAGRGIGLRIMRYRAQLIGATLQLGRASGGGTLLRCLLPAPPAG